MVQAQEQKIHLTMQLDAVPPIWGDHDRLMQIFTNLVDNALAHTPPEGQVHLSLRRHNAQAIEAVVQDTGSGIEPQDLSRIFERFYQIDRSRTRNGGRQGSGLGLAIVRELVEAHHGRIQARSQVGEGSAFIVRLPISDDPQVSTLISREL